MLSNYSVLIIGNPYDSHLVRFVKYIKQANPFIELTVLGLKIEGKSISEEVTNSVKELFLIENYHRYPDVPVIRSIVWLNNIRRIFNRQLSDKHFDIVNIHYPLYYYVFLLKEIKRISSKIVVTPWGSDVYRISKIETLLLRKLYNEADIVTGYSVRFTDDCKRIFRIPERKYRYLSLFIDQIDYYVDHKDQYSLGEAKKRMGINESDYVITCGYNGSPSQRHLDMINAIYAEKTNLPSNITLLFPFTYAGTKEYKEEIKRKVNDYGLSAIYCEHYLDLNELFTLRMATDMFIHIQTTDANNGTLKEYVWFHKNIINGSWLKYDDLESNGVKPYHSVDSVDELSSVIVTAYNEGPKLASPEIITGIEKMGCRYWAPKWIQMYNSLVSTIK